MSKLLESPVKTSIGLPPSTLELIRSVAGNRKVSEFIRGVVDRELEQIFSSKEVPIKN